MLSVLADNDMFLIKKNAAKNKCMKLRKHCFINVVRDHDWLSIASRELSSFTAVERLTCLLCVTVTETALCSWMFGNPDADSGTSDIVQDLALALWSPLIAAFPLFLFQVHVWMHVWLDAHF